MVDPDAARAVHETGGVLKRLGAALGEANSSVEKAGEVERP